MKKGLLVLVLLGTVFSTTPVFAGYGYYSCVFYEGGEDYPIEKSTLDKYGSSINCPQWAAVADICYNYKAPLGNTIALCFWQQF